MKLTLQGYIPNKECEQALISLLNLARELREDRRCYIFEDVTWYAVPDVRYATLEQEACILISKIPADLPERIKEEAESYIMSLYKEDK